jgi:DNA polymerase III sliding clamp (beta) subunit (PCNA family)
MTKLTFDATLFRAVYIAVSNEASRYYLQGVYVTKAPGNDPGVVLCATDGHSMLIGYDPHGSIDGEGVILQTEGNKVPGTSFKSTRKEKGRRYVQFDTESRGVAHIYNALAEVVGVALMEVIDGSFPEFYRIIPDVTQAAPVEASTLNAHYVAEMAKASVLLNDDTRTPQISFWAKSAADPVLVTFGARPDDRVDLMGIVMPLRANSAAHHGAPLWARPTPKLAAVA